MNNFQYDDLQGRMKFKEDFGKYYIIQDTDHFDSTDVHLTACTTCQAYTTEIKKRSYDMEVLSASTIIEKTKLDAFRQIHKEHPERCLTYFNYYNGGWISFDITNRLNYMVDLDHRGKKMLPRTTSGNNELVEKDVLYLCYTSNMYVKDKMCVCSASF